MGEIVCYSCGLPSAKGLPPFVKGVKGLRHQRCPEDAKEIGEMVVKQREDYAKAVQRHRMFTPLKPEIWVERTRDGETEREQIA